MLTSSMFPLLPHAWIPQLWKSTQYTALPKSQAQLVLLCAMPYKLARLDTLYPTRQIAVTKMRLVKYLKGLLAVHHLPVL